MELKHVKGIGPAKQAKLNEAGIHSVEDLARADAAKLAQVAKDTGFSEATVREYKERAVALTLLQDVRGVGPATVQTLAEAGVRSVKELYEASSERLAKELQVARGKVQELQADAKRLAEHVSEESKTPEGRRRLAQESREFLEDTARRTQEEVKRLIEQSRHDGERFLAKAEELREKAPEVAREYREKAEEAFRRAEEATRQMREKAGETAHEVQVRIRTEAEKVKAANEGIFMRLKQRFQRRTPVDGAEQQHKDS